jgi:hypothetical protein
MHRVRSSASTRCRDSGSHRIVGSRARGNVRRDAAVAKSDTSRLRCRPHHRRTIGRASERNRRGPHRRSGRRDGNETRVAVCGRYALVPIGSGRLRGPRGSGHDRRHDLQHRRRGSRSRRRGRRRPRGGRRSRSGHRVGDGCCDGDGHGRCSRGGLGCRSRRGRLRRRGSRCLHPSRCRRGSRRHGGRRRRSRVGRGPRRRDGRCGNARRKEVERVDVPVRVGIESHAEMHVRSLDLGVAAGADRADGVAILHGVALLRRRRAEMGQGHRVSVGGQDREGLAARRHGSGECHRSCNGRVHGRTGSAGDVDAAVLAAGVGIDSEHERA